MCTSLIYHHLFILLIPWITTSLNTFITDNDTYWHSTSPFLPRLPTSNSYGRIRLRQHMKMSLMIEWYGRVSSSSSSSSPTYEQIIRLGWPATLGGCTAQNSRYPSLWIDNQGDFFHLSISQDDSCGQGWRTNTYIIEKYKLYSIYIEFNDTNVYMTINNTIVLNQIRTSPTRSIFINKLMNIYIPSDYWSVPYTIANVSLFNINIESYNPYTTMNPTDYPTVYPTAYPTISSNQPTLAPFIETSNPSFGPTNMHRSPTTENPTKWPTLRPTIRPSTSLTPTTIYNINKILTTNNKMTDLQIDNDDASEMDTSNLLYLLITGITSCIVGTCLILITIKKCGDFKKSNKKFSSERLSFQMKKLNEKTDIEFEINGHSIPLKPGKQLPLQAAQQQHVSPIPKYINDEIEQNIEIIENKKLEPGHGINNNSDSEESNITTTNNTAAAIEHVMTRFNGHLNIYAINEGNGTSNDTELNVRHRSRIIGIDGMDEDETMLTQSETMSPSRLNMPIRKYLMSESIEEEYIKQLMDGVVIRHDNNNQNQNQNNKINYSYKVPKKRLSSLLIISDNEALDGSHLTDSGHGYNYDCDEKNHHNNIKMKIFDDDDDDDVYDDETLPILPGTNTINTANDRNDGESLTEYGVINEGYEWITMALLQIDDQDWKIYLDNFQINKVNEKRLVDLKRGDIRELIPNIGPRNEFEKLLRIKLGKRLSAIYDNSEY